MNRYHYIHLDWITEQKLRIMTDRLRYQVPWGVYTNIRRIISRWLRGHIAGVHEINEVLQLLQENSTGKKYNVAKRYQPARKRVSKLIYPTQKTWLLHQFMKQGQRIDNLYMVLFGLSLLGVHTYKKSKSQSL